MQRWKKAVVAVAGLAAAGYGYWKLAIPVHRVAVRSELVMLGDLDGDHRWAAGDLRVLDALVADPFREPAEVVWRLDLNQNALVDEEDVAILRALVAADGDPYAAEAARPAGGAFPRPRELYRYVSLEEYRARPHWALDYPQAADSVSPPLVGPIIPAAGGAYTQALDLAIRDEAIRLDAAYRRRLPSLKPIEAEYAARKLARVEELRRSGERFELLLSLMDLVEDAETLTAPRADDPALALLRFRDHLREVLRSPLFADFEVGRQDGRAVLRAVSGHLEADLGLGLDLERLGPPRDLGRLSNYLDRAEWQYFKSTAREEELLALVAYAQHDPRYLRAVSRTSRRHQDPVVENHNLPMVLLFREALRLEGGDKKKAVGLLDEAIRIPYAWIRSLPRDVLPGSVALDNFLLPGNMEDGADKSRHWNVFGGICLYRSPREALELALRRELQDLRERAYAPEAMREFLRDMIANLNGMYHVMSVDPDLLASTGTPVTVRTR